jgi:hypothetical protein
MLNPLKLKEVSFLSMVKNVTTLTTSQNKNLNGQHCFLLFKVANIVAWFGNNNPNQLQKKLKFIMSLNCLGKMKFKQQWPQV